uniref:Uncharacterized protein n=1 Tax=Clytia hemisphaerica TaxID=252671 RepID=A0A7M5XFK2_9CNID
CLSRLVLHLANFSYEKRNNPKGTGNTPPLTMHVSDSDDEVWLHRCRFIKNFLERARRKSSSSRLCTRRFSSDNLEFLSSNVDATATSLIERHHRRTFSENSSSQPRKASTLASYLEQELNQMKKLH